MNIASEIKRCIETVKKQGFMVEVRPAPTVSFDTLKRRAAYNRYAAKVRAKS